MLRRGDRCEKGDAVREGDFPTESYILFDRWRLVYDDHLRTLYRTMTDVLKNRKEGVTIPYEDFVLFAFKHSSGYISPYA